MYKVFACGSNGNSQLGLGNNDDQNELQPVLIPGINDFNLKPLKISCGGNHTLMLLENGTLLVCGDNSIGQCCLGDKAKLEQIQEFTFAPPPSYFYDKTNKDNNETVSDEYIGVRWKDVSAGWEFSILVDTNDQVWSVGNGLNGELGIGKLSQETSLQRLNFNENSKYEISRVSSSIHSTIMMLKDKITKEETIYVWGNNKKGQLYELLKDDKGKFTNKIIKEPFCVNKLENDYKILDFVMCRDFTVFKLYYINTGEIKFKLLGKDNFGIAESLEQLNGDNQVFKLPLSKLNFQSMWSSIHAQIDGDEILSIGNNSHGQKFLFGKMNSISSIDIFKTGSEHGILVTGDKKQVYTWGWGEHGNCGKHGDKIKGEGEEVVFDYLNLLYTTSENYEIEQVFGGNATTWVILKRRK